MRFGCQLYGKPSEEALVRSGLSDRFCFGSFPGEQCFLITPDGKRIDLLIRNRVPYFSESAVIIVDRVNSAVNTVNNSGHRDDDLVSEPDIEYSSIGPETD